MHPLKEMSISAVAGVTSPPAVVAATEPVLALTRRQMQVLQLLMQRKPNRRICRDLHLSEGTVKAHVSAIFKALNVHSRAQVVTELSRRGSSAVPRLADVHEGVRPMTLEV